MSLNPDATVFEKTSIENNQSKSFLPIKIFNFDFRIFCISLMQILSTNINSKVKNKNKHLIYDHFIFYTSTGHILKMSTMYESQKKNFICI